MGELPWLIHGFSTRGGGFSRAYGNGDLNLGFTKDDTRAAVERNRAVFLRELRGEGRKGPASRSGARRVSSWPLITLRQIHSDIIRRVDSIPPDSTQPDSMQPDSTQEEPLSGDGMITATPGLLLGIQVADCLPVIIVTRKTPGCWRISRRLCGTVQRIVREVPARWIAALGSNPRDLKAADQSVNSRLLLCGGRRGSRQVRIAV